MLSSGSQDLKARIYACVDVASADFCCPSSELDELLLELETRIHFAKKKQLDLNIGTNSIPQDSESSDAQQIHTTGVTNDGNIDQNKLPMSSNQALIGLYRPNGPAAANANGNNNINFNDSVDDLERLANVVRLQQLFSGFDSSLGDRKYHACVRYYEQATRICEQIEKDKHSILRQLNLVKLCSLQYRQRKVVFSSRIERGFQNFINITVNTITCGSSNSCNGPDQCHRISDQLGHVWSGFAALKVLPGKAKWLAQRVETFIIDPLFQRAYELSVTSQYENQDKLNQQTKTNSEKRTINSGILIARAFKPHDEVTVWSIVDTDAAGLCNHQQLQESKSKNNQTTPLEMVTTILESLVEYLRDYLADGRKDIFRCFSKHLWLIIVQKLQKISGDPDLLIQFEKKMCKIGFIKTSDKSLSAIANDRRSGFPKRTKILENARNWMISQDMTTLQMSDASTEIYKGIDKNLHNYLFPRCCISAATHKLVQELEKVVQVGNQESDSALTKEQQNLCRKLLMLFILIRPHVHRKKLTTDPFSCAIFLNDCNYIAFILTTLPFQHGANRPITWLIDFVPQLRKLGETHFSTMIRHITREICSRFGVGFAENKSESDFNLNFSPDFAWNQGIGNDFLSNDVSQRINHKDNHNDNRINGRDDMELDAESKFSNRHDLNLNEIDRSLYAVGEAETDEIMDTHNLNSNCITTSPELIDGGDHDHQNPGSLQQQQLQSNMSLFSHVSHDEKYAYTEDIVSQALQYLKTVLSSLSAVLPRKTHQVTTKILVEHMLEQLLRGLLLCPDTAANMADRHCLGYLFQSVRTQIFYAIAEGCEESASDYMYEDDINNKSTSVGSEFDENENPYLNALAVLIPMLEQEDVSFKAVKQRLMAVINRLQRF